MEIDQASKPNSPNSSTIHMSGPNLVAKSRSDMCLTLQFDNFFFQRFSKKFDNWQKHNFFLKKWIGIYFWGTLSGFYVLSHKIKVTQNIGTWGRIFFQNTLTILDPPPLQKTVLIFGHTLIAYLHNGLIWENFFLSQWKSTISTNDYVCLFWKFFFGNCFHGPQLSFAVEGGCWYFYDLQYARADYNVVHIFPC